MYRPPEPPGERAAALLCALIQPEPLWQHNLNLMDGQCDAAGVLDGAQAACDGNIDPSDLSDVSKRN